MPFIIVITSTIIIIIVIIIMSLYIGRFGIRSKVDFCKPSKDTHGASGDHRKKSKQMRFILLMGGGQREKARANSHTFVPALRCLDHHC